MASWVLGMKGRQKGEGWLMRCAYVGIDEKMERTFWGTCVLMRMDQRKGDGDVGNREKCTEAVRRKVLMYNHTTSAANLFLLWRHKYIALKHRNCSKKASVEKKKDGKSRRMEGTLRKKNLISSVDHHCYGAIHLLRKVF